MNSVIKYTIISTISAKRYHQLVKKNKMYMDKVKWIVQAGLAIMVVGTFNCSKMYKVPLMCCRVQYANKQADTFIHKVFTNVCNKQTNKQINKTKQNKNINSSNNNKQNNNNNKRAAGGTLSHFWSNFLFKQ